MNFLLPDVFNSLESFQSWFDFSQASTWGCSLTATLSASGEWVHLRALRQSDLPEIPQRSMLVAGSARRPVPAGGCWGSGDAG